MTTLIRAAALTNYFEVARDLGLNPQPLLQAVGLGRAQLAEPENRIPLDAVLILLERSAEVSGCITFGLRMAESRQLAHFGVVSLLLSHQPTLREALKALMQYRHLLNESLAMHLEEAGETVIIREELVGDAPMESRQGIELALGTLFRTGSALLGANLKPISVNFTHGAPADTQVHRRVFRCPVHFGAEFNGIVCHVRDLDRPNPAADPAMARYAKQFVESLPGPKGRTVRQEVRKAIYLLLPMGRASIEQVAEGLGLNVRTLQRQLAAEDGVFSELVSEVRRELVVRYLENPDYSLATISELLGYSVPSSFTRWFSTQFGMTPQQWRKRKNGAA
ncbi:MAG: AraC family transcriptional regulator [Pseudomonadales bacterium]